jgi:hypothetical protein
LLPPRLCATVLLACTPFNFGGHILYFESAFLSSDRCRFVPAVSARPASSRGAEPTSLPPSLSTRFVDPSLPPFSSVAFATFAFRGRRLLPPPRWVSTPLVDFVFRLSLLLGRGLRRQCDFAFPSEGRGFYHRRVRSQLPSSTLFFPPPWNFRSRVVQGGAASTTAALRVNSIPPTPYSVLGPRPGSPPPLRLRPVEGAGLLPPLRLESTRFFDSIFPPAQLSRSSSEHVASASFSPTSSRDAFIPLSSTSPG